MSKKMLKRSLALGALMAFVITGSAMFDGVAEAREYKQALGKETSYTSVDSKEDAYRKSNGYRAVGGSYNVTAGSDTLNSNLTIDSGKWNMVVGGHYIDQIDGSSKAIDLAVESTLLTIKDGDIEQVVGGNVISDSSHVSIKDIDSARLVIYGGNFGGVPDTNCPETFVVAGDLVKWGSDGKNKGNAEAEAHIGSTYMEINGGIFNSVIIGASASVQNYEGADKSKAFKTSVGEANTIITDGEFSKPIVAGGLAWGNNTSSTVETANLIIDGTNSTYLEISSVYAGGVYGNYTVATNRDATVGESNIIIKNATVDSVYGNALKWELFNQKDFKEEFSSYQIKDDDACGDSVVSTNLTLTNATVNDIVDIQEGSVTLATTGNGTTEVKTLKTGTGVAVSMVADGTATDTLNGNAEAFRKKIAIESDDGLDYTKVKGLMKAGEVVGDVTFELDEKGNVKNVKEALHKGNASVNSMSNIALMAWRAETNDMNKRMGELRNANGEHGVWVRVVGGEDEYKSVEYDYTQYQLGYDEKLSTDPTWTVGMALTYTDGESKFAQGSGENEHKGVAIYGSKLNADGSFVDLIAKYSRLEHDFTRDGAKGDYSTNGYSVSAEYGKRYEQSNGLWIEPQVELTYGKVKSADYKLGSVLVNQDAMESLIGRVGFSIGKDIKQGNVYARASYLYDFEGETATTFTNGGSRQFEDDLGGDWWEVGVGANINLSKATYVYADVEKTFGGEVDTNWQWNLGVRYSF